MKIYKSFKLALNILLHSKLRSWLTIIGIIIGIAAVVSIISISQGAQSNLEEQLGGLGADIITITQGYSNAQRPGNFMPGGDTQSTSSSSGKNLTSKDINVITSINNINYVMGQVSERADLTYLTKSLSVSVIGVDESSWKHITTSTLSSGRFLTNGDKLCVVIGGNLVNSFDNPITLNSKVNIEGVSFRVVGILEEGREVYIPINSAREILEDVGDKEFDSILVKIEDIDISNETVTTITKKLMISRGILDEKKQDFTVSSPTSRQETIKETMNTMTLFLGAIAAISLIVGAIGIANTMFTSVLEKTKEIGVMKSIGAKDKDILTIFLLNSGLIGLVGGIGGIILGVFGSGLISYFGSSTEDMGMSRMLSNTAITPELLIFSLLFSVMVGMIAGAIPAYRASRLNPVEALRYE